ncbi:Uncharacterized protein HZ326_29805 [Fusarium oxysporum f. sp. albedinis]|nr:Uncharacterized protein HZ326_29805 [Fusarium oxysporum f. sp. albedinis]
MHFVQSEKYIVSCKCLPSGLDEEKLCFQEGMKSKYSAVAFTNLSSGRAQKGGECGPLSSHTHHRVHILITEFTYSSPSSLTHHRIHILITEFTYSSPSSPSSHTPPSSCADTSPPSRRCVSIRR